MNNDNILKFLEIEEFRDYLVQCESANFIKKVMLSSDSDKLTRHVPNYKSQIPDIIVVIKQKTQLKKSTIVDIIKGHPWHRRRYCLWQNSR